MKYTNRISRGVKIQIKADLLQYSDLLCDVFMSALRMNIEEMSVLCLEGLENWVLIGFPLLNYCELVQLLLNLLQSSICMDNISRILR